MIIQNCQFYNRKKENEVIQQKCRKKVKLVPFHQIVHQQRLLSALPAQRLHHFIQIQIIIPQ